MSIVSEEDEAAAATGEEESDKEARATEAEVGERED